MKLKENALDIISEQLNLLRQHKTAYERDNYTVMCNSQIIDKYELAINCLESLIEE